MQNTNSTSLNQDRSPLVPLRAIRIALRLVMVAACVLLLFTFLSNKQWQERNPDSHMGPESLWTSIFCVLLPLVPYARLRSPRSPESTATGARLAAGLFVWSLMLSPITWLTFAFDFGLDRKAYLLPVDISLAVVFAISVWIAFLAFRIGRTNWTPFLRAAGGSCISALLAWGVVFIWSAR